MNYLTALHTDKGIRKDTNQDSMLLMQASTSDGEVLFAVVCDGMGGLKKGELASAEVVRAMATWFRERFPQIMEKGFQPDILRDEWMRIVEEQDERISRYGAHSGMRLGTTLVGMLCVGEQYYIINIGDSRVYQIEENRLLQLTNDHTWVQQQVELGRMTMEEAEQSPQRSVLTQCVGAGEQAVPDFMAGGLQENQAYLLCCDGFRHVPSAGDLCRNLNPGMLIDEPGMHQILVEMTEDIKRKGETDNISAILIRTCR